MTDLELKELVEGIDAKNAEYILNNYDVLSTFRQINDWGTDKVNWLLKEYPEDKREEHRQSVINSLYEDLKKKIARYDSIYLTPANAKVGDGATIVLYTDRNAGTIVKVTKSTITIRRDKAILSPDFKPEWIPGGFAAHCTNQDEQTYTYEPDENGALTTVRWSKKYNSYGQPGNIRAIKGRREFYDYTARLTILFKSVDVQCRSKTERENDCSAVSCIDFILDNKISVFLCIVCNNFVTSYIATETI